MKRIVITGATSGIGEATARYLSEHDYQLLMVARNEEKLRALCAELGEGHEYCVCDLSDYRNVSSVLAVIQEEHIIIDGMVYSAGVSYIERFRNLNMDAVDWVMRTNCYGFVELARLLSKRGVMNDGSSIVAVSSLTTETELPGSVAYSMSKSALNSACSTLSKELVKRGIRVNTVMPACVSTPMTTAIPDAVQMQPLGWIEPQEVAMLIEFLLSDRSKKITGANVPISAGMQY